ncbi:MAG: aldo/keto reductase [Candidatus Kapaibacterium sp.]|nr:MAG: aldo/keto reductase [Candidatus Kapabacteria bacterium]
MQFTKLSIPKRPLLSGSILPVSALGFGAGHIGGTNITENEAGTILNRAVDLGVTLIDTARGYGMSEERIGRHLSYRRKDVVLVSKCGYSIPGYEDWTPMSIHAGIDMALRLMRTDYLDVMLLHSCPKSTLERPGLIEALEENVKSGKLLAIGYSGENDDLEFALSLKRFDVIETSVNPFDQRGIFSLLPKAKAAGVGVIAKRPLGNAPWRYNERPVGNYAETYWERMTTMQMHTIVQESGLSWDNLALRFSAFAEGVTTAIVGTTSTTNLQRNIEQVNDGALPTALLQRLHETFQKHDNNWTGQV